MQMLYSLCIKLSAGGYWPIRMQMHENFLKIDDFRVNFPFLTDYLCQYYLTCIGKLSYGLLIFDLLTQDSVGIHPMH